MTNWMTGTRMRAAAIGAVALFLAGACSSTSGTGSGQTGSASAVNEAVTATRAAEQPLTATAPGPAFDASGARGKTLWIIDVASSVPIVTLIDRGAEKALGALGAHVVRFDGKGSVGNFATGINRAIAEHADGIALLAIDPAVVVGPVQQALKAGIPVVTVLGYDPRPQAPGGTSALATYCYTCAGQDMASWIVGDTKGHGATINLITANEQSDSPFVVAGFKSTLAKGCPACTIVTDDVPVANWATSVEPTVRSTLISHPDIKYVVPVFDGMAPFAVPAVETSQHKNVKIVTFNGSESPMQDLAANKVVFADVGSPNAWMGWAVADQFARLVTHNPPLQNEKVGIRLFDSTNIGSINVGVSEQTWYGADFETVYRQTWELK